MNPDEKNGAGDRTNGGPTHQATHDPTVLAQSRVAIDLICAGAAINLFHASPDVLNRAELG
jgi:hypothetical protein